MKINCKDLLFVEKHTDKLHYHYYQMFEYAVLTVLLSLMQKNVMIS